MSKKKKKTLKTEVQRRLERRREKLAKERMENSQLGPVVKDKPDDIDTKLRDATIKKFKPKVKKKVDATTTTKVKKKVDATTTKVKKKKTKAQINKDTQTKQNREAKNQAANKQGQNVKPAAKTKRVQTSMGPQIKKIKSPKTKTSIKQKIKDKLGSKYAPYVAAGGIMTLAGAIAYLNKGKKPSGSGGSSTKPPRPTVKPPKPSKIDPTAGDKIRKDRKIPKGALDASGDVKGLPSYFNNPIFKKEIKERGGRKNFLPDNFIGKLGRLGTIGDTSTDKLMAKTVRRTLQQKADKASDLDIPSGNEMTSGESKLLNELNTALRSKSKKKGGMVKRKYGGKVKRNMGGMVSPRKKAVFRRGGGKALRGFGNATYSNKMY